MSAELITLVLGFLTLAGGQIATALVLVGRMDRQADQTNRRFDEVYKRFDGVSDGVNQRFDGVNQRFDGFSDGVNQRFDGVNQRFDDMSREFADLRERMARLEGVMEGLVAGRRDRGVA